MKLNTYNTKDTDGRLLHHIELNGKHTAAYDSIEAACEMITRAVFNFAYVG